MVPRRLVALLDPFHEPVKGGPVARQHRPQLVREAVVERIYVGPPLYPVVAVHARTPGFLDELGVFVGRLSYREQSVKRAVQGYEGFAYIVAKRHLLHGVLDRLRKERVLVWVDPFRVVIVGVGTGPVRVELLPVDPLRGVPFQ